MWRSESYLKLKKSHFIVQERIVLAQKVSKKRIEVDKAKVDLISNLTIPAYVKHVRPFLGMMASIGDLLSILAKALILLLIILLDESK